MIYEPVEKGQPIRQGDIFTNIPRVGLSLNAMAVSEDDGGFSQTSWLDFVKDGARNSTLKTLLSIKPETAIVITQDCDCARSQLLSLCQIVDFSEMSKAQPQSPKNWQKEIIKIMSSQPKLFYLPQDPLVQFDQRKAVDFRAVLPILRTDLETLREFRVGRLNQVAYEHFREMLAQFFRRYPVNAWYPLTPEEFASYSSENSEGPVQPYAWQNQAPPPTK